MKLSFYSAVFGMLTIAIPSIFVNEKFLRIKKTDFSENITVKRVFNDKTFKMDTLVILPINATPYFDKYMTDLIKQIKFK